MVRPLLSTIVPLLLLGAAALSAQTDDLKAFLDRGRSLSKAEKFDQALPYFLFALEIGENEFGADSPSVLPILTDLGELYASRTDYGDAEPLFERALAIQEQQVARHQAGIARTLNNLGSVYEATERRAAARELYQRILTKLQPALGSDHPNVQWARLRLAKLTDTQPLSQVAAPLPPPSPSAAPAYRVHLTSIRRSDGTEKEWRRLREIFPALLGDLAVTVTRVDLGAKGGVWYRIQGGPLDRAAARRLCAAFQTRGIWCSVVRVGVDEAPFRPPKVATTEETMPAPPARAEPSTDFRIHLTSIRKAEDADAEWMRLRSLFTALLETLELSVVRADLGSERGVWYRIQGGPLNRSEARGRCASFAQLKVWCRVVPPPGNAADGSQRQVALRVRRRDRRPGRGTWRPKLSPSPEPGARRFPEPR